VRDNDPDLNPSIGTFLNDKSGALAKEMFLNKPYLTDVKLQLGDGGVVQAHRTLLRCRSRQMATLLEAQGDVISIPDGPGKVTMPEFLALVEFFYTEHSPISDVDPLKLLALAHHLGVPRLVTLCELHMSKVIERAVQDGIAKADVDVIGILVHAQAHNAQQLAAFCLHFISTNYGPMQNRPEWGLLKGENLKYVEQHQWPPKSYHKKLTEYERLKAQREGRKPDESCSVM